MELGSWMEEEEGSCLQQGPSKAAGAVHLKCDFSKNKTIQSQQYVPYACNVSSWFSWRWALGLGALFYFGMWCHFFHHHSPKASITRCSFGGISLVPTQSKSGRNCSCLPGVYSTDLKEGLSLPHLPWTPHSGNPFYFLARTKLRWLEDWDQPLPNLLSFKYVSFLKTSKCSIYC